MMSGFIKSIITINSDIIMRLLSVWGTKDSSFEKIDYDNNFS